MTTTTQLSEGIAPRLAGMARLAPVRAYQRAAQWLQDWLAPVLAFGLRAYVGWVFLHSGMIKAGNWDNTLFLFANDYHVPLLPPLPAALAGTAGELGFSALLVLGLAGRLGALGLFAVNLTAALSFPDISELGLQDHWLWGTMLAVLLAYGPGRISLDHALGRWVQRATRT